jgi:glycosyltransferase involved in cell wall biosynthesis
MRVSVVIPVFERQALGERALRSARSQAVDGMEIVVVDDASDPAFELPADLAADGVIRTVRHEENRGAGRARDTGVAAAKGEWIAFLDSDDYWLPGTLAPRLDLAESAFSSTRDPMVAYAAGFVLDRKTDTQHHQETRIPLPSADIDDFLSGCWFAHGSTALLHRKAFAKVGVSDPDLRRFEDYDWFVRFALAGGRLEIWPQVAAIVEVTRKPRVSAVEDVVSHLRAKYTDPQGPYRLPPKAINRLEACFDFELASSLSADRKWLPTLVHLARSFWRVPRTTLHLRRLWKAP